MKNVAIPDETFAQVSALAAELSLSRGEAVATAIRGDIELRGLGSKIGLPGWSFSREGDAFHVETPIGVMYWPLKVANAFVLNLGKLAVGVSSATIWDIDAGIQIARKGNGLILTRRVNGGDTADDGRKTSITPSIAGAIIAEMTRALQCKRAEDRSNDPGQKAISKMSDSRTDSAVQRNIMPDVEGWLQQYHDDCRAAKYDRVCEANRKSAKAEYAAKVMATKGRPVRSYMPTKDTRPLANLETREERRRRQSREQKRKKLGLNARPVRTPEERAEHERKMNTERKRESRAEAKAKAEQAKHLEQKRHPEFGLF
ncbi:hypothetical protein VQ042_24115 [Aurantimonas sp. A2-1-M11]|uniref:hypothetical protein n=1 Tax=Aurantimonas sp. A2-1-M11 TaxID=3113712 RepID=UPI002F95981B